MFFLDKNIHTPLSSIKQRSFFCLSLDLMATTQENIAFLDVLDNSIASLKLPSLQENISEIETIQKIHNYFRSIQNSNQSADEKKMVDFIEKRLRYMAKNSSRIKVNQNQLNMLVDLSPNANIIDLLSAYYACFYLTPVHSKAVLEKQVPLLNELLCAAYHDIIKAMIDEKLPHYENLARHLIMLSELPENIKSSKIKKIVDDVAEKYKLTVADILVYFENRVKNKESFEHWPAALLNEYMQVKKNPENATFDNFLREKNLRDLFNDDEVEKYNLLFNSYVTKLVNRQLGKFVTNQVLICFIQSKKLFLNYKYLFNFVFN
jgi:hypothetical protein